MRLEALLPRDGDCINCPATPQCNCAPEQTCFLINRSCNACAYINCVASKNTSTTSSSGGVSKGALAGGIIGSLIFLALAVCAFLYYRRRLRSRGVVFEVKPDIPASAETVLNRPDPVVEKPPTPSQPVVPPTNIVRVYSSSNVTIDLDPQSQNSHLHPSSRHSTQSNPFSDSHSIQTAGTESTNVIPIALVSPDHRSVADSVPSQSSGPVRPPRSPDLNLDHANVSLDSIRPSNNLAAPSQRSGVSGVSSRNSYMSNASFASDFLNEAPMIITPVKGSLRVVKAEVINAGTLSTISSDSSRPGSRQPATSPLASSSFGPADIVKEEDEESTKNPFEDAASSPSASVTTFGHASNPHSSVSSNWVPDGPRLPWTRTEESRPSSLSTQAGSVIDIGSATRVHLGLATPTVEGTPRSPFRTTMGRIITPNLGSLEEQQQRALDHAQARANAQGGEQSSRRISASSVMTAASRADSILESFPFVPPSPISDRPMRSPPVSPLAQQSFTATAPPPRRPELPKTQKGNDSDSDLLPPPSRRTLGLSTASQFSTASSGLGSFPFQIDSGSDSTSPTTFNSNANRQRASLDTLALTSDLSSYPLGFDRDSVAVPPIPRDNKNTKI